MSTSVQLQLLKLSLYQEFKRRGWALRSWGMSVFVFCWEGVSLEKKNRRKRAVGPAAGFAGGIYWYISICK